MEEFSKIGSGTRMEEKMPSAAVTFSKKTEGKIAWTPELAAAARVFRDHGFGLLVSTSCVTPTGYIHQSHGIIHDTDLDTFEARSVVEVFAFEGEPLFYGERAPEEVGSE